LRLNRHQDIPPLNASALLKRHGLRADKRLGQNFLQDPSMLEKIALAAEIQAEDTVLEIGAGLGSLTRYLAVSARKVIALELDSDLLGPLKAVIAPYHNVRVEQGDILKLTVAALVDRPDYLVVANIPYNITSAIIRHLLESQLKPRRVVLTVQRKWRNASARVRGI
jgi:16S rRNA (adenine1518-N6/adenine1519-N6)-dimethyltransferase